jgi:hypothetical protein
MEDALLISNDEYLKSGIHIGTNSGPNTWRILFTKQDLMDFQF